MSKLTKSQAKRLTATFTDDAAKRRPLWLMRDYYGTYTAYRTEKAARLAVRCSLSQQDEVTHKRLDDKEYNTLDRAYVTSFCEKMFHRFTTLRLPKNGAPVPFYATFVVASDV